MNVEENIAQWQKLAKMDLATARHMFETYRPIPIEIVCFHSQQTAEKMLKCFLIYNRIEPPKTHDIQTLLEMCIEIESGFNSIYKEAALLTRYAVIPRYPAEIELIDSDGETALKYADIVMNFIKGLLAVPSYNFEIRKLTPDLAEDYVNFFDITPHSEKTDNDECKCYCVWWCSDDQNDEVFENYLSSRIKRRDYAIKNIRNNKIQGYLAYYNGKVVGWCNTNTKADCLKCFCWRRFMVNLPTEELALNIKIKSIFCFLVAPDFRRKGITKLLLERVCQDAKKDGFNFIEGYPKKEFVNEAVDFMGSANLFTKSGFIKHCETEDSFVMRKSLK